MNIEICILAGGQSKRMGQDKGTLIVQNKEMLKHILDMLQNFEIPIRLIANQENYQKFGIEICKDLVKEKGAMGGLYTALATTKFQKVLVLPCDMPFLPSKAISLLLDCQKTDDFDCIIAQVAQRIHPLLGIYQKSLLPKIDVLISQNKLKMQEFIFSSNYFLLEMDDLAKENPAYFQNMNTPDALLIGQNSKN